MKKLTELEKELLSRILHGKDLRSELLMDAYNIIMIYSIQSEKVDILEVYLKEWFDLAKWEDLETIKPKLDKLIENLEKEL